MWGTVFAIQPERTLILHSCIEEEPPLPDRGAAAFDSESHAFGAILEFEVRNLDLTALREGFPIRLEVFALEPRAPNLFGEEPVLHGMIDVFEKLPVDPFINWSRDPVGVD